MQLEKKSLLALALLASLTASAQFDNPKAIFRELTRLDGTWFMPTDRGDRLEVWKIDNDSTMTGKGFRIKADSPTDTVLLETLRLELRDTTITYHALVRGQNQGKFVAFKLTSAEYDEYLFENPAHDDPKKIVYHILARRELQVTTEGVFKGRPTKQEFTFEREFNPASMEFRGRAGLNYFNLLKTNDIGFDPPPQFSGRPGWEAGIGLAFRGSGSFISLNIEAGVAGRYPHVKANPILTTNFDSVSGNQIVLQRDLTYRQTWLVLSILPEMKFSKNARFSLLFGLNYAFLLGNGSSGTDLPTVYESGYQTNKDFKTSDLSATLGFNWRANFFKKDLDGRLSLRGQFGLSNIDNLYNREDVIHTKNTIYNGRVGLIGASLTYSINLLKI